MTVLACLSLAIWIYLLALRGGFWRIAPDLLPQLRAQEKAVQRWLGRSGAWKGRFQAPARKAAET